MPLTPTQTSNLNKVKDLLDLIRRLCPNIARLDNLTDRWNTNTRNNLLEFDTARVVGAEASAPAYTENKNKIYIREDLSPGEFDLSTPGGVGNLVNLMATLVHEMFHQLCSSHPTTYIETADFLAAVIACLREHKEAVKQSYNWTDIIFDSFIGQLEGQEQSERRSGTLACCFTVKLIANIELAVVAGGTILTIEIKRVETGQTKRFNFYGGGVGVGVHFGLSIGESDPVCCSGEHCPSLEDFAGSGTIASVNLSVLLGGGYVWINFDKVGNCGPMSFSTAVGNIGGGLHLGANWGTFRPQ